MGLLETLVAAALIASTFYATNQRPKADNSALRRKSFELFLAVAAVIGVTTWFLQGDSAAPPVCEPLSRGRVRSHPSHMTGGGPTEVPVNIAMQYIDMSEPDF